MVKVAGLRGTFVVKAIEGNKSGAIWAVLWSLDRGQLRHVYIDRLRPTSSTRSR